MHFNHFFNLCGKYQNDIVYETDEVFYIRVFLILSLHEKNENKL